MSKLLEQIQYVRVVISKQFSTSDWCRNVELVLERMHESFH
ncbi:hypothetical protein LEP1GSC050_2137 [Leptospira broomii serovar Hurstbridge str. 5399]|uniref:Uncharacterized protein n=1 Tax=Leptospira broomii serovar Hurstbridge str. 5399 TaxID=1049789 RepID=T0FAC3_9LEPT|nr:hypothetical protein LEP1GSC050_2137 [Leptospira broomii serovar Hurstbridge str. 5399]